MWGDTLTVVRDGVKIHDNVEIPGPTGGALDSNEGEPGPFFLQGDHHGRDSLSEYYDFGTEVRRVLAADERR